MRKSPLRASNVSHASMSSDLWYTTEDANARPPSLAGAIEVRWRGSVVGSQDTKRRLFSEKTSVMEWVRVGLVSRSSGRTVPIAKSDTAVS